MLKLLIVDDEPVTRSAMRRIIEWEQYGYEICGEAGDGPAAAAAIVELKPDLTLIDMHLPGFSGLDVIRKTKETGTHFIILSDLEDFTSAREAIHLAVDGYIMKPVDKDVLTERIIAIARKIAKRDDEELRRIQFLEVMEGRYKEERSGCFCFNNGWVQAVFMSLENSFSDRVIRRANVMRNFFQEYTCHLFHYRGFMVFLFENTPEAAIKRLMENVCGYWEKSNDWFAITLGGRCREDGSPPGAGIQASCREAEQLMESLFFYRGKKCLFPEDMPAKKDTVPDYDYDEEIKKLCVYIQIIDHKKIRSFFQELGDYFFHSGKSPRGIRQECMALMIEVRGDIVKKFPSLKKMRETGREILERIMELHYLDDIIDAMIESCLHIGGCLPLLSTDACFQRIISYVNNNYNEDLRLETLGQLFHYNCAYLGKRFKEYTGKNFHTYLDTLRIDAAKELLHTTDMKVYEISTAIGYANTDYFHCKFKKYTGKSPLFFRKEDHREYADA